MSSCCFSPSRLLRRLATLLSQQATLMASNEAFKKQAEGANDAAKKYMEENEKLQEVSELCMKMPVFHDPKGIQGAETFTWYQVNDHWCNYRTCGRDSCIGDCDEYAVLRNCSHKNVYSVIVCSLSCYCKCL